MATFYNVKILSIILVLSLLYSDALPDAYTNAEKNTWCIAKPIEDIASLKTAIRIICSKADCSAIQKGGSCFDPDTPYSHASYAMNLYYQNNGRNPKACDLFFGLVVDQDPSFHGCHYPIKD